ncbi:hypothetical protein [Olleya sp. HaHaR_3_96]|uniref:hypothetical protein n=1 Tax=Olleya sp. HaHaR_3_96 TaxID=2745560 RepID=UPI001C4EE3F2|nr:hypothetical protein [Olleya sp. HaHaR_3_96]QXP60870.1 hypothetical protein H0I26_04320 [Olleya sp. HaHaR_3_96]
MTFKTVQNTILCALFTLVCACQQTNTNTQKNDNTRVKDSLTTLLSKKDSVIHVLSNQLISQTRLLEDTKSKIPTDCVKMEYINFLFTDSPFLLHKDQLVKTIIDELQLDRNNIMTQVWEYSFPYTSKDNTNYVQSKIGMINHLWNTVDRSTESINTLLTDNDKLKIYDLFKHNTIYKDSGIAAIVKGLITAYNEIENNENAQYHFNTLKSRLYDTTDDYSQLEETERIANEDLASATVTDILSDENYTTYPESYSYIGNRVFYVYSFWARRQTEGNQDVVYLLLKQLDNTLAPNDEEH